MTWASLARTNSGPSRLHSPLEFVEGTPTLLNARTKEGTMRTPSLLSPAPRIPEPATHLLFSERTLTDEQNLPQWAPLCNGHTASQVPNCLHIVLSYGDSKGDWRSLSSQVSQLALINFALMGSGVSPIGLFTAIFSSCRLDLQQMHPLVSGFP